MFHHRLNAGGWLCPSRFVSNECWQGTGRCACTLSQPCCCGAPSRGLHGISAAAAAHVRGVVASAPMGAWYSLLYFSLHPLPAPPPHLLLLEQHALQQPAAAIQVGAAHLQEARADEAIPALKAKCLARCVRVRVRARVRASVRVCVWIASLRSRLLAQRLALQCPIPALHSREVCTQLLIHVCKTTHSRILTPLLRSAPTAPTRKSGRRTGKCRPERFVVLLWA